MLHTGGRRRGWMDEIRVACVVLTSARLPLALVPVMAALQHYRNKLVRAVAEEVGVTETSALLAVGFTEPVDEPGC
jgi:hypothetical protein